MHVLGDPDSLFYSHLEVERLEENVQDDPPCLVGDLAALLRLKVEDVHQGLQGSGGQVGIAALKDE